MSERFLSRWSRKKSEANAEPSELKEDLELQATQEVLAEHPVELQAQEEVPIPTEADLASIEQTSDVSAFLNDKVPQALKNQAFKALFKNPKFNHVDMMDVYMEDYNTFVPLTAELRDKMSQIKQLLSRPDLEEAQDSAVESMQPDEDSGVELEANAESSMEDSGSTDEVSAQDDLQEPKHGQNDSTGS